MNNIDKAIEEYNKPIDTAAFVKKIQDLLEEAKEKKEQQPKNEETRHWAVVYTQLESTLAYVKTYLGGSK